MEETATGTEPKETATLETHDVRNHNLFKRLAREKAELAYKTWVEELKTKYPININSEQWDKITATPKTNGNEDDSGESKSD